METQTRKGKEKELRELSVNQKGQLSLEGKVVNAALVDEPFIVTVNSKYDYSEPVTMHNMHKAFKSVLHNKYAIPQRADAYISRNSMGIRNFMDDDGLTRLYAVQLYELRKAN